MLAEELKALLLGYPNIVLSLTGHTHKHVVSWIGAEEGGFWEVQTCALVDFPGQFRLVEIADEDNGFLSIQLVCVDFATDNDVVAEEGRRMCLLDYASGWGGGHAGTLLDRNVKLYAPVSSK